jgi:hypothetical protein
MLSLEYYCISNRFRIINLSSGTHKVNEITTKYMQRFSKAIDDQRTKVRPRSNVGNNASRKRSSADREVIAIYEIDLLDGDADIGYNIT